ncbi:Putative transposon Tn552 DNA-invertase bin3 [[Clostridium] hylemonae DSM 15053]|uniref:recombinase family protein n=1 Tax=[Clostridium] hylemonae TaxID=89153 RepID=UPI0011EDE114|nr:recombinase family protein [[Clostridium] hylemonae]QEK18876.1 Putative transposon Tn552 DNA-invertase bin3 [[Clostridium] hylemonae DSM 15053]
MNKKCYGYVRVSSKEQNIGRQIAALEKIPVPPENIFIDKQSGKDFDRPNYQKMIDKLCAGDVVFVKSIDRLGRNYDEIIEQWRVLTKAKDVDIVVIDFPLLDTRNQVNGLTGKFIADIVLQILSYVAQIERENIRQRQAEGMRGKVKGVSFGRPAKEIPEEFPHVFELWRQGKISMRRAAKIMGTNHTTVSKWIKLYMKENDIFLGTKRYKIGWKCRLFYPSMILLF